jgi:hypothetical protein
LQCTSFTAYMRIKFLGQNVTALGVVKECSWLNTRIDPRAASAGLRSFHKRKLKKAAKNKNKATIPI